ncbi:unnamed protein product [Owenia fusiformis]|uniref:Opsin n=1 Tax=Owenia fusiformis TaxID=6347 RepID=A0A8S4PLN1_OWEFU|nr:unnamed protein product [Owenia fusiformis]
MSGLSTAALGLVYSIFGILGVVLNGLALATFTYFQPQPGTKNIPHVNLLLASFGVSLSCVLPGLASFSGSWGFNDIVCQIQGFYGMLTGMMVIYAVAMLAGERYVVFKGMCPSGVAYYLFTSLCWFAAGFWSCLPLMGCSRYTLQSSANDCILDWKEQSSIHWSYILAISCFGFAVPLAATFGALSKCHAAEDSKDEGWFTESQLIKISKWQCFFCLVQWLPFAVLVFIPLAIPTSVVEASGLSQLSIFFAKGLSPGYPVLYVASSGRFRTAAASLVGLASSNHVKDD